MLSKEERFQEVHQLLAVWLKNADIQAHEIMIQMTANRLSILGTNETGFAPRIYLTYIPRTIEVSRGRVASGSLLLEAFEFLEIRDVYPKVGFCPHCGNIFNISQEMYKQFKQLDEYQDLVTSYRTSQEIHRSLDQRTFLICAGCLAFLQRYGNQRGQSLLNIQWLHHKKDHSKE